MRLDDVVMAPADKFDRRGRRARLQMRQAREEFERAIEDRMLRQLRAQIDAARRRRGKRQRIKA